MAFAAKKTIGNKEVTLPKLKERKKERNRILKSANLPEAAGIDKEARDVGLEGEKLSPEIQKALATTPAWYIELFNYIHLFNELEIDVTIEATDETNPKADKWKAYTLERQLFLIFECLPKVRWDVKWRLTQKEFARFSGVSETVLSIWKRKEWFWGNRVRMMKRIFSLHTPDVIDALYLGSTRDINAFGAKDAKCIKLWLEYVEWHISGIDVTSKWEGLTIQFASNPSNFIEAPKEDEDVSPQKNDVDPN